MSSVGTMIDENSAFASMTCCSLVIVSIHVLQLCLVSENVYSKTVASSGKNFSNMTCSPKTPSTFS